ncbi:MAG: O-methyltransferase [Flavobacteriales bacterium]|jgi:predicted O-methyltransferase YrrM|nr:O-methyltransferase [Flavobacteriales bacterium]
MDLLPELEQYAALHSSAEPALLAELVAETHRVSTAPRMLSGHVQGRLLSLFSHLLRPRRILEIGTFTGYSALCLAEGMMPDGELHTVDIDARHAELVGRYVARAGWSGRIHQHIAPAAALIPELPGPWDLVFIDADKQQYTRYFELVVDRVRPGGLIIADNVLWSGKVLRTGPDLDDETRGLADYATRVKEDPRVESVLLTVRDGALVSRRV